MANIGSGDFTWLTSRNRRLHRQRPLNECLELFARELWCQIPASGLADPDSLWRGVELRNVVAHAGVDHVFRGPSAGGGCGAAYAGPEVALDVAVGHGVLQAAIVGSVDDAICEADHRLLDIPRRRGAGYRAESTADACAHGCGGGLRDVVAACVGQIARAVADQVTLPGGVDGPLS